ncbi:hypothetical protein FJY90_00565 [Candidatus Gottesmanbacteria bacterium]|nr:hypothetical protein [Candidatus Gottesmanbacteria bacterium]
MRKGYHLTPKKDEEENTDEWMMTYGDLVTQLLCFFILLMSFSVISSIKFREVVVSLQEALSGTGALPAWQIAMQNVETPPLENIARTSEDNDEEILRMIGVKSKLDELIKDIKMSEYVETKIEKEGLVITLKQDNPPVFFDTAEAKIKPEAYPILNQIVTVIKGLPNKIKIEGHTDIRPINTPQFPSNWELSTMRATNVLRYLTLMNIQPERLSAAGYGQYRPIAKNENELGMSKNRRVEIVILYHSK